MNEIKIFDNPEFGEIRTMCDDNNEPLFCAIDLCSALGHVNPRQAISNHVDEDDVTKRDAWVETGLKADGTPARRRTTMNFVNESGMYSLIFGSKLDKAKAFKRWVTSEVLPAIRKTGAYAAPAAPAAQEAPAVPMIETGYRRYTDTKARVYLIEAMTRNLGLSYAARLTMFSRLAAEHGIEIPEDEIAVVSALPAGHVTRTVSSLLSAIESTVSPQRFNRLLLEQGYMEKRARIGYGNRLIEYFAITPKGLEFGKNEPDPRGQGVTSPKWYVDRFEELYDIVAGEY